MAKVTFGRLEIDDETTKEGQYDIYLTARVGGRNITDTVGSIFKSAAWNGDRHVASGYEVEVEVGEDGDTESESFPVKGVYGGRYGAWSHRRGFNTAREALSAAKDWARNTVLDELERPSRY
jgi:hypothetical protein